MSDIPRRHSEDEAQQLDSLQYVDAGTVHVASTSRTSRYWETHQMSPHVDAAADDSALAVRPTALSCFLLAAVNSLLVRV